MENNIVIAVTLDTEAVQQYQGRFKKIHAMAAKFLPAFFKKPQTPPPPPPVATEQEEIQESGHNSPTIFSPSRNELQKKNPERLKTTAGASPAKHRKTVIQTMIYLHPIILIIRQQELGKSVMNLAVPMTIALLITNGGKSQTVVVHLVLVGLTVGCTAIWCGILFRETFPQLANFFEQLGIVMVLMSVNGFVASAMPMKFAWVPMLCGGLCMLPFLIAAALPHDAAAETDENLDDGG